MIEYSCEAGISKEKKSGNNFLKSVTIELLLDRNTWNHFTLCKLLDQNHHYHITVSKQMILEK